jgi:hypothetical protein
LLRFLLQAARVFVVDLLMSAQGGSVRVLPCLAAALDAWPEALPALAGAAEEHGGSDDHVHVLHSVLQQMCADTTAVDRCGVSGATHAWVHTSHWFGAQQSGAESEHRLLIVLGKLTSGRRDFGRPENAASAGDVGEALRLMALRLQDLGHSFWGWHHAADADGYPSNATADETWAALHRLVEQEEAEML